MQLKPRPFVYAALALLAAILAIAGTTTPVYVSSTSASSGTVTVTVDVKLTLWKYCAKTTYNNVVQENCVDIDNVDLFTCGMGARWQAMRAFCILTLLLLFLGAVPLAVVDLLHVLQPSIVRKRTMESIALAAVVCSVIAWAIWVNTWEMECNGSRLSESNGSWGPMAPLMVVVSILGLAMGVVAQVVPGAVDEEATAEGTELQQQPQIMQPPAPGAENQGLGLGIGVQPSQSQPQFGYAQQQPSGGYAYPPGYQQQPGYPPQQYPHAPQHGYPPQHQGYVNSPPMLGDSQRSETDKPQA